MHFDVFVKLVEQSVQGNEVGPAHRPVRLLRGGLQCQRVGEPQLE